jgi:hypothetical protein
MAARLEKATDSTTEKTEKVLCATNPRILVFWKRIFGFLCALIGTPTDADRRRHHGKVGVCQRPSAYPISSIPFRNPVAFCLVAAGGRAVFSVVQSKSLSSSVEFVLSGVIGSASQTYIVA